MRKYQFDWCRLTCMADIVTRGLEHGQATAKNTLMLNLGFGRCGQKLWADGCIRYFRHVSTFLFNIFASGKS